MKSVLKLSYLMSCLWLAMASAFAQAGTTMYVNGRFLYSAAGEKVVFRGVNEMFIYSSDIRGVTTLPQIAMTGANVVRICWNTSGTAADLDALLGNCIANKLIPIVELDNSTGNLSMVQTCVDYWKRSDILTAVNKYKKWVLVNIANEAGDNNTTDAQYQTTFISAVSQLRQVGYTIPFIIDANSYGQNENSIFNTWQALLQSDTQHNLVFSLHPYWKDSNPTNIQTRFTNVFTKVIAQNIPFMLGEGPEQKGWDCTTTIPYNWVMQQCQTNQIGWLVWTWGKVQDGAAGCGTSYDVTTNGLYGSWSSTWGSDIAVNDPNSIKNTSVRPPSIVGSSDTQTPTAPTLLSSSAITSVGATLTWKASTDNVGVAGYRIYSGTTLLSTTTATSLALIGLNCATAYSFTVKAFDAAGNVSVASNTVTLTTGACSAITELVYADALNVNWADWSWGTSVANNYNNTSPVKQGTKSIRCDFVKDGGFALRKSTFIYPPSNTLIRFWVYSTTSANMSLYTMNDDSGQMSSLYAFTTIANQWKQVTVNMASIGNPSAIKRLNIQNNSGGTLTTYFDNIEFAPLDTQAPTVPTGLTAASVTQNSLSLSWTAATDNVGVTAYEVYQNGVLLNGNVTTTTYAVSGLVCNTAYSYTVKAKDAAGNVSGLSTALSKTTAVCTVNSLVIYDDALSSAWQDWSWSAANNFLVTSPLKVGARALGSDITAWGAMSFRRATVIVPSANTTLHLWVYTPAAVSLRIFTSGTDTGNESSGYFVTTTANAWTELNVTTAQLGSPTQIQRVNIQNNSANTIKVYVDDLKINAYASARVASETKEEEGVTMVAYPNPASDELHIAYRSLEDETVQLGLVELSGKAVYQQTLNAKKGENTFVVPLSKLDSVTYILQLKSERGGVLSQKVQVLR